MTLQEAYFAWRNLAPFHGVIEKQTITYTRTDPPETRTFTEPAHYTGNCCAYDHCMEVRGIAGPISVPAPDDHPHVCARERAWRTYVRIRDGAVH